MVHPSAPAPLSRPLRTTRPPLVRGAWVAVGALFVGLAAAGAVLPLVPTTPFLLVAAACYARGSPRLHAWLLRHRVFGPTLRTWAASRALPPGVKLPAVLVVLATFSCSLLAVDAVALRWLLAALGVALVVFLARLPVVAPAEAAVAVEPAVPGTPGDSRAG
jgi:hypothetical protein